MTWKINWVMAVWGVSFGIAATLTGLFMLSFVRGFFAEGFFLLVMGWVLLLVFVAKITSWMKLRTKRIPDEKEE